MSDRMRIILIIITVVATVVIVCTVGEELPSRPDDSKNQSTPAAVAPPERRAYPGAPPVIPHEVDRETAGNLECSGCHERGGFVPRFKAFSPVTPHPQRENCLQCHLPQTNAALFRESLWPSVLSQLPDTPPPIPHEIELGLDCLSCHAGPDADEELRTPHPERLNCVQCHVPTRLEEGTFVRPVKEVKADD